MSAPPADPGFEVEVPACRQFLAWLRRRVLLLCLLRSAQRGRASGGKATQPKRQQPSSVGGATAATAPATAAAHDGEVLIRVASLPEELWQGPLIFQFL